MFGQENQFENSTMLRNEIAFQNLIAIANNPILFDRLDDETKEKLIYAIVMYTKGSLDGLDKINDLNDYIYKQKNSVK